ncbi:MAG: SpoIIE family protein phosphatase [Planctomycetaceae bacterium]|nr:SpoIIE family protein phosphatase [Planctomycetales bacterium]MCB9937738.1 SpoIIE family protein phosphatase [Planctomycetaceae bacterium]
MAFLTANNGPQAGRRYELDRPESVLGRHPECDVVIDVGAVSRYHCKVIGDGSRFAVEDLNSRNGTFVNEQVIEGRKLLEHGNLVRVCDVVFTFHEREQPPSSSSDDSSFRAVMVDDESSDSGGSTIMSKLDVRSSINGPLLAASAEAKLSALIEITRSLSNTLSLDKVLPDVLDSLFRIFVQADRGFVGIVDANGVLVPRWTKLRREDKDDTIRVSRTIAKTVMETKEAILSADAASDVRFEMSQSIADFRIRSMMCAPLVDNDQNAFGILQIDTLDQRQRFREDDLELLVSTAAQASFAINNARLHEDSLKQRSIERDLQLAREVQKAFLPQQAPDLPDYTFYSYYQAANHIGGDYYDYVPLPNGNIAVIVADVVGHGVAAAMLMAKVSAESRFCLASEADPAVAITKLNRRLCELKLNRFVTFILAVINPATHEVTIVNAGHMAPMLRHVDGTVDDPGQKQAGIPLGIVDDFEYNKISITLQPQELLTLYTDGLDEAADVKGEQYSIDRMREGVKAGDGTPEGTGKTLIADIRAHITGCPQDDDMCLVVLRRD